MAYFVAGATGFIGRHLVSCLLERDGDVHVLIRAGSTQLLRELTGRWSSAEPPPGTASSQSPGTWPSRGWASTIRR